MAGSTAVAADSTAVAADSTVAAEASTAVVASTVVVADSTVEAVDTVVAVDTAEAADTDSPTASKFFDPIPSFGGCQLHAGSRFLLRRKKHAMLVTRSAMQARLPANGSLAAATGRRKIV
ncbi:MAG: hypothetical protein ACYCOX_17520 [Acidobacteriaceae bacterium]